MSADVGTLLVVDDNENNLDLLCRRLERKGYLTTAAAGGQQALELVNTQSFDLILLDVMMPDIDGLTVLTTVRQTYSAAELPIIMVTAKTESADIVTALELGANDYVTKPIDFPVVLARVRTQLSRKWAETALRESEERYALAMNGANDGLWDWNLTTHEIYFSSRWKVMLGLPEDEPSNKPDTWFSLVHPEDRAQLQADIGTHCQGQTSHVENEHRMLHADGTYRWMLCRGMAVYDIHGQAYRMAGSLTDITERKIADSLTGLPNRLLFLDRLGQAMIRLERQPDYYFAVLFLDLDRFRVINDSLGTTVGDQLLIAVGQRLGQSLRAGDTLTHCNTEPTIARLDGDGFAILLDNISRVSDAIGVTERLQQVLTEPFVLDGHEAFPTASVGIVLSSSGYKRPEDYLRDAEMALKRAKPKGPGSYELFDTDMHSRAMARLQLETDLRRGIEMQEFQVYYQPIVNLATGKIAGFEALIRWQHPERGLLSPVEFIPVSEETGLIVPIGTWILNQACRQICAWQLRFPLHPPLFMSINLSVKQLQESNFTSQIENLLRETNLTASSVKLEITETMLMENTSSITAMLQQIRDLGMQISLDDFGTGYSSLSYLHKFPINTLKIDRSFISRMDTDSESTEIVRTIVSLAHNLNMDIVAEGVETASQLLVLRELGCEYGQGYFVSKPLNRETIEALLEADPQW